MSPGVVLVVLAAYALGCFNAGYYWPRLTRGIDIRELGSGNAGARNAGRLLGAGSFFMVLALDAGKGILAVWLGLLPGEGAAYLPGICALAATLGHVWPAQLQFKGGKGAATALGVCLALALSPASGQLLFAVPGLALLMLYTFRYNLRDRWRRHIAKPRQ